MPRTEKKPSIINNSYLIENSYMKDPSSSIKKITNDHVYIPENNYHSSHVNGHVLIPSRKYEGVDMLRNKLLKKGRIMSSNQSKPSWW